MNKKYQYALLHFFESIPAPRYFGIIIQADEFTNCPPVFNHMYAFQWVHSAHELSSDSSTSIDIKDNENFDVSNMYYIAKRFKPEHLSKKAQFYTYKNGSIQLTHVTTYMQENNLHLLIPYMATDMEYELFVPATEPKSICISQYLINKNLSMVSVDEFAKQNFVLKCYEE